jgi:hypothetical protein
MADGLWHHLAGVYDCSSQRISIYLDGAVDAWQPLQASLTTTTLISGSAMIPKRPAKAGTA